MKKYDPKKIEPKWQKYWAKKKLFEAEDSSEAQKKYVLIEFPYPSGAGLHMGHMRPFIAGDVTSKYWKLKSFNTMYPIGWDAFGLPAENYAIKNNVHPEISTKKNIENARKQLLSWGTGFDWSREINTTDPDYYKWTQWLFLEFFKKGLAYEATGLINWCPKDKTGLANEEVVDGKCERCGSVVEKKELRQWYLKITDYAEKLLDGLKNLPEWPEPIKLQQENWIGKSEGAEISFKLKVESLKENTEIKVFTTRADTLFGVTYLVIAPEHELISKFKIQNSKLQVKIENWNQIEKYISEVKNKPEAERTAENKEKTGIKLEGVWAVNPANNEKIPVFVADYVLASYGTGAVMAVPAYDERDAEFSKVYNLPVKNIELSDKEEIIRKFGKKVTKYKLRDWVFSRQRYWGEPIPLIHCEKCGVVPVPEKDLPVVLPKVKNYEPTGTGESPLASIEKWVNTTCPTCGGKARRETNTMPQWAGSSWYWLRYMDSKNKKEFSSLKNQEYWSPVDLYFGGLEHTTLHLLYSRFWNLFLYDQKLVKVMEPYRKRVPHGIILGPDGEKMSKSRGNVVNPDEIVSNYGADTVRMYMMFLGPHGGEVAWNDKGIIGTRRFLERFWNLQEFLSETQNKEVASAVQKAVKKVGEDIEKFAFNTAISAMMIAINTVYEHKQISRESFEMLLKILTPFAPHITEELWSNLGNGKSIYLEKWPEYDEKYLVSDTLTIMVQINGKVRGQISVLNDASEEGIIKIALSDPKIKSHTDGKEIKKTIFVKGKIINFVLL